MYLGTDANYKACTKQVHCDGSFMHAWYVAAHVCSGGGRQV